MTPELTKDVLEFLVSIENDTEAIPQFMMEWRDKLVGEIKAEMGDDDNSYYADGTVVSEDALPFFNEYYAFNCVQPRSANALRHWVKNKPEPLATN
jgi:hypothetical protein